MDDHVTRKWCYLELLCRKSLPRRPTSLSPSEPCRALAREQSTASHRRGSRQPGSLAQVINQINPKMRLDPLQYHPCAIYSLDTPVSCPDIAHKMLRRYVPRPHLSHMKKGPSFPARCHNLTLLRPPFQRYLWSSFPSPSLANFSPLTSPLPF